MKVVLFCGGLGMRMREFSEAIPKPMVHLGYRPMIWYVMKYYAHYGHKDFILCLGYKADVIKNYFLNYNEYLSNDFTLSNGGKEIKLENSDIDDWKITFVDTGVKSNIGERLKMVEKYLEGEEVFMANYSDGLTDMHLPDYLNNFLEDNKIGSFLWVRPNLSFHVVSTADESGLVNSIQPFAQTDLRINGGYFVLRKEIFQYMKSGEELVIEPFRRLIEQQKLIAYKYDGFWMGIDTFKDKQVLDKMYADSNVPWEVWNKQHQNDRNHSTLAL